MSLTDEIDSVSDYFAQSARRYPESDFLHVPVEACKTYSSASINLTYSEAYEQIGSLRTWYQSAGFGIGHRVALSLENRPEFFIHFLALNGLGASIVPINPELSSSATAYLLENSDATLVVALPGHAQKLDNCLKELSNDVALVIAGDISQTCPEPMMTVRHNDAVPSGEACLLYTSGTTGNPKGCILSNEYFLGVADWYLSQGGYCKLEEGCERLITPLPLYHSNALAWSFVSMVGCGGCVVMLDRFHPSSWWSSVVGSQATIVHYLGVMPAMLLNMDQESEQALGDRIKFGFGAGVDPKHHQAFEDRFGFPLIEAWAMTETGAGAVAAAAVEPRHVGTRCFGRPGNDIDFRIVGHDGAEVKVGTPGQLLVRRRSKPHARYFFSGYYKNPEETQSVWEDDWFHTGDIVKSDSEGSLFFVDRLKNIVRRSGENIAAVEIEGVLLSHESVDHCAVVPVPDELRGEEVFAFVLLKEEREMSEALAECLFNICLNELAYFKAPGYLYFVDSLPMTGSQKIQRSDLKKLALQAIKKPDCLDFTHLKRRQRRVQ